MPHTVWMWRRKGTLNAARISVTQCGIMEFGVMDISVAEIAGGQCPRVLQGWDFSPGLLSLVSGEDGSGFAGRSSPCQALVLPSCQIAQRHARVP